MVLNFGVNATFFTKINEGYIFILVGMIKWNVPLLDLVN